MAQSASAKGCDKVEREDELQECLGTELATVDKELNAAYAKLRGGLNKEAHVLLTKAQRLWVSLRDADCELEAESHKGGSGYQAIYIQCQIDKTRQRIKDFKSSRLWPRG
ncbi:lysozyme inhibitor LprI family protein [Inhella inkyongensis]|uniref:lysozyme inhibitor LprI family protein n=1 Tax=Inhella inkyongensis TaxID=392593 RepID=UPI001610A84B|nr:lysozyme inhibitor LprI family protein [Inhella inkyongensis]